MSEKEYVFVGNAQLKTRDYIKNIESENKKLQRKIDKAIEYIKEHKDENNYVFLLPSELQVILSILGDKE